LLSGRLGSDAELAKPRKIVFDPERGHESPVMDTEDVDLVNVLEAPSGRGHTEPFAEMRPGALEPGYHLLALGDQIDDLHLKVRKRALKRTNPAPCDLREPASRDLTENFEVSLPDGLINQATDQQLVLLSYPGSIAVDPKAGTAYVSTADGVSVIPLTH
jgi:hypothetical protein